MRFGSQCRESSPSEPTDGHDININDSINGQEAAVADKQSSISWLYNQTVNISSQKRRTSGVKKKQTQHHLQKEASRDFNKGQLIDASESTPHPFNSSVVIFGASMLSVFSFGHIPKLRDRRPT